MNLGIACALLYDISYKLYEVNSISDVLLCDMCVKVSANLVECNSLNFIFVWISFSVFASISEYTKYSLISRAFMLFAY